MHSLTLELDAPVADSRHGGETNPLPLLRIDDIPTAKHLISYWLLDHRK